MKYWSGVAPLPISFRIFIHAFQICWEGSTNAFPWTTSYLTVKRRQKPGFLWSLSSPMKVESHIFDSFNHESHRKLIGMIPNFPISLTFEVRFSTLCPWLVPHWTSPLDGPPGWRPFAKIAPWPSARPGSPEFEGWEKNMIEKKPSWRGEETWRNIIYFEQKTSWILKYIEDIMDRF